MFGDFIPICIQTCLLFSSISLKAFKKFSAASWQWMFLITFEICKQILWFMFFVKECDIFGDKVYSSEGSNTSNTSSSIWQISKNSSVVVDGNISRGHHVVIFHLTSLFFKYYLRTKSQEPTPNSSSVGEVLGSHGGEYEDDFLDVKPCSLVEVYLRFRSSRWGRQQEPLKRR
jgi:hypothetical protein